MITVCLVGRRAAKKAGNTIDLRDPKVRQEFLTEELMKANQKISEGMELNVLLPGRLGKRVTWLCETTSYMSYTGVISSFDALTL